MEKEAERYFINFNLFYILSNLQFYKTAKDLCDVCNLIALSFLDTNNKEEGLTYLMKAEKLFRNHKELLNIIYNNIGCYYRL